jgi:hypothetical protein
MHSMQLDQWGIRIFKMQYALPKSRCKLGSYSLKLLLFFNILPFILIFSVLQGSVSEYCFHNCKAVPVIIVPGKGQF